MSKKTRGLRLAEQKIFDAGKRKRRNAAAPFMQYLKVAAGQNREKKSLCQNDLNSR